MRFDDRNMTFTLDVRLPDEEEWLHVDIETARECMKANTASNTENTRKRLLSSVSSNEFGGEETPGKNQTKDIQIVDPAGGDQLRKSTTLQKYSKPAQLWGQKR